MGKSKQIGDKSEIKSTPEDQPQDASHAGKKDEKDERVVKSLHRGMTYKTITYKPTPASTKIPQREEDFSGEEQEFHISPSKEESLGGMEDIFSEVELDAIEHMDDFPEVDIAELELLEEPMDYKYRKNAYSWETYPIEPKLLTSEELNELQKKRASLQDKLTHLEQKRKKVEEKIKTGHPRSKGKSEQISIKELKKKKFNLDEQIQEKEAEIESVELQITPPEAIAYRIAKDEKRLLKVLYLMFKLKNSLKKMMSKKNYLIDFDEYNRLEKRLEELDKEDNLTEYNKLESSLKEQKQLQDEIALIEKEDKEIIFQLERLINEVPLFVPNNWVRNYLELRELKRQRQIKKETTSKDEIKFDEEEYKALFMEYNSLLKKIKDEVYKEFCKIIVDVKKEKKDKKAELSEWLKQNTEAPKYQKDVEGLEKILSLTKEDKAYRKFVRAKAIFNSVLSDGDVNYDVSEKQVEYIGGNNHPFLKVYDTMSKVSIGLRTSMLPLNMLDGNTEENACSNVSFQHARRSIESTGDGYQFLTRQYLFKSLGIVRNLDKEPDFIQLATEFGEIEVHFGIEACEYVRGMNLEGRTELLHQGKFDEITFKNPEIIKLVEWHETLKRSGVDPEKVDNCFRAIVLKDSIEMLLSLIKIIQIHMAKGIVPTDIKPSNLFITVDGRIVLGDGKSNIGPFRIKSSLIGKDEVAELDSVKTNLYFVETSPSYTSGPMTMLQVIVQSLFTTFYHFIMNGTPPYHEDFGNLINWQATLDSMLRKYNDPEFHLFRKEIKQIFRNYNLVNGGPEYREPVHIAASPKELKKISKIKSSVEVTDSPGRNRRSSLGGFLRRGSIRTGMEEGSDQFQELEYNEKLLENFHQSLVDASTSLSSSSLKRFAVLSPSASKRKKKKSGKKRAGGSPKVTKERSSAMKTTLTSSPDKEYDKTKGRGKAEEIVAQEKSLGFTKR